MIGKGRSRPVSSVQKRLSFRYCGSQLCTSWCTQVGAMSLSSSDLRLLPSHPTWALDLSTSKPRISRQKNFVTRTPYSRGAPA